MIYVKYDKLGESPFQALVRPGGPTAEGIHALAANIKAAADRRPDDRRRGLRQLPELEDQGDTLVIRDGHRRIAAFQYLHEKHPDDDRWDSVPVNVSPASDSTDNLLLALDTNLKEDLSPVGWANALQAAIDAGVGREELQERYGLSQSQLSHKLRLLKLPAPVLALIDAGTLTERHGRALLTLESTPFLEKYLAERGDLLVNWTVSTLECDIPRFWSVATRGLWGEAHDFAPWFQGWNPGKDPYLTDADRADFPHRLAPCDDCPHAAALKRGDPLRCTDDACYVARRELWYTRLDRRDTVDDEVAEMEAARKAAKAARMSQDMPPPRLVPAPTPTPAPTPAPAPAPANGKAPEPRQASMRRRADYIQSRAAAQKKIYTKRRWQFVDTYPADRLAALFSAPQFLRWLAALANSPRGWGNPPESTDPDQLRKLILNGVVTRAEAEWPGMEVIDRLERVITELGGASHLSEAADLSAVLAVEVEELMALAGALGDPPAPGDITYLEGFPSAVWAALTPEQALEIAQALEAAIDRAEPKIAARLVKLTANLSVPA